MTGTWVTSEQISQTLQVGLTNLGLGPEQDAVSVWMITAKTLTTVRLG